MSFLWALIALLMGFGFGYWVCAVSTWIRVHRLEGELRNFSIDIQVLMDMDDEIPAEWVQARVDSMISKEFR